MFSVPPIGFNNTLVACGAVRSLRNVMKKKSIGEDLVTAAVLHRGLISGQEIDKAVLVGGYCSCFLLFLDWGFPGTPPEEPAVHLIVRRAQ